MIVRIIEIAGSIALGLFIGWITAQYRASIILQKETADHLYGCFNLLKAIYNQNRFTQSKTPREE